MIELILVFVAGVILGHRISSAVSQAAFKKILEELGIREKDMRDLARRNGISLPEPEAAEPELEEIHIKLEQHQGQIYAFRMDNDGFLGQGKDRDSLIQHLQQRMMNVRLIVDEGGELIAKTVDTQPK